MYDGRALLTSSAAVGLLVALLLGTRLHSYLLFHSFAEGFSIAIASGIFMIVWNARRAITDRYLMVIGISYLFVGLLDFLHTLAYQGIGIFFNENANLATQLWISARYLEAVSFLAAPAMAFRKPRAGTLFAFYTVVTALLLGAIFFWGVFPECWDPDLGLTPFKKRSEYVICLILLVSTYLLYRRSDQMDTGVFHLIVASMVAATCAELMFTLYNTVDGTANLLGHVLKFISFYLIYKAVIEIGLTAPLRLLLQNLKQHEDALVASQRKFRELSITDDLTRLFNARHFHAMIQMEMERAVRYRRPLSLIFLDIDDFKEYNDTYGHPEGDRVLSRFGETIPGSLRITDTAFRYGGEEFAVLLPETPLNEAQSVAYRICQTFESQTFSPAPGCTLNKTVSGGVAQFDFTEDPGSLLRRADEALYAAKRQGKNRVVCASEDTEQ